MNLVILAIACGVIALLYGILTSQQVLRASPGNQRMVEVAGAIQEGAMAYLNRQYMTIAAVGALVFIVLWIFLAFHVAFGFLLGAVLSGAAGYIGMTVSVHANVRTAEAARRGPVAFLRQVAQTQPVGGDERHLRRREEHRGDEAEGGEPDEAHAAAWLVAGLRRAMRTSTIRVRSIFSTVTTTSGVSTRSALRGTRPKRSSTQPPTVS